jgi:hypothetical protein
LAVVVAGEVATTTLVVVVAGEVAATTILVVVAGEVAATTILVVVAGEVAVTTILVVVVAGEVAVTTILVVVGEVVEIAIIIKMVIGKAPSILGVDERLEIYLREAPTLALTTIFSIMFKQIFLWERLSKRTSTPAIIIATKNLTCPHISP